MVSASLAVELVFKRFKSRSWDIWKYDGQPKAWLYGVAGRVAGRKLIRHVSVVAARAVPVRAQPPGASPLLARTAYARGRWLSATRRARYAIAGGTDGRASPPPIKAPGASKAAHDHQTRPRPP